MTIDEVIAEQEKNEADAMNGRIAQSMPIIGYHGKPEVTQWQSNTFTTQGKEITSAFFAYALWG